MSYFDFPTWVQAAPKLAEQGKPAPYVPPPPADVFAQYDAAQASPAPVRRKPGRPKKDRP